MARQESSKNPLLVSGTGITESRNNCGTCEAELLVIHNAHEDRKGAGCARLEKVLIPGQYIFTHGPWG